MLKNCLFHWICLLGSYSLYWTENSATSSVMNSWSFSRNVIHITGSSFSFLQKKILFSNYIIYNLFKKKTLKNQD